MKYQKGTFVVVPNKDAIAGQKPIVQTVFFWLCSFADDNGVCFPSRTTLAELAGCSVPSVDEAIKTLEELKILTKKTRKNEEKNNLSNLYQIELVEGGVVNYRRPPSKLQTPGVASTVYSNYIHILTQSNEQGEAELRVERVLREDEAERVVKPPKKYPHAEQVFKWFPKPQPSWKINTTELKHAELLFERGEAQVKKALAFYDEFKDEDYCPQIRKPSDLERKWQELLDFKKKVNV